MNTGDIILIIISGLGVIHGIFLGLFLLMYKEGNIWSNRLLSILLFVMSFRVGKSVLLEFSEDLDDKIIFIGLSTLMALGPLFYFFVKSCMEKAFTFKKSYLIHFIPMLLGLAFGFQFSEMNDYPKALLIALFVFYYFHFLTYLLIGHFQIRHARKNGLDGEIYAFLRLLLVGLLIIWFAYVLNLFDEIVPYVMGPILYSVVAYVISFLVFRNGYIQKIQQEKYKSNPVSEEQSDHIYSRVIQLIKEDGLYKKTDLSLKTLSADLKISPQILSAVINRKSQQNFNSFINSYRIEEAMVLLKDEQYAHQTIASIAFEVGFNSISSFNTAFKKQTNKTPVSFRKDLFK